MLSSVHPQILLLEYYTNPFPLHPPFWHLFSLGIAVVAATAMAMFGSFLTIGSCNWVRLRAPSETNRNLGIWTRSSRGNDEASFFSYCEPYPSSYEPTAHHKLAKASSILAPLMGSLTLITNIPGSFSISPTGAMVGWGGSVFAAIFQGLTLTIHDNRTCRELASRAFCSVGISTWAFWVSLVATILYVFAVCVSFGKWSNAEQTARREEMEAKAQTAATQPVPQ